MKHTLQPDVNRAESQVISAPGVRDSESLPLVTVVTITYNLIDGKRGENIVECLESVHRQSYPRIEHLVIDGASTDGTVGLLQKYVDLGWITLCSEKDSGIYDAMNKGVHNGKGKYVAFLNSDDFWHDAQGVLVSIEALERTGADFSFGPAFYMDSEEHRIGVLRDVIGGFFVRMPCCHQSMFVKREVIEALGGFRTKFRSSADFDFVLRLCLAGHSFVRVPLNFTSYRHTGISAVSAMELGDRECAAAIFDALAPLTDLSPDEARALFDSFTLPCLYLDRICAHLPERLRAEVLETKPTLVGGDHYRIDRYAHLDRDALPTVLFDATVLHCHDIKGVARTGIFFATYNILRQFSRRSDLEVLLYAGPGEREGVTRLFEKEFSGCRNIRMHAGEPFNIFLSPYYRIPDEVRQTGCACFAILYDTIMLRYPDFFTEVERTLYREMLDSYRQTDGFFAISSNTKQDFVRELRLPPRNVTVTPLAAAETFVRCQDQNRIEAVKQKYGIPAKRYIFSLCSLEPRKNLVYAVRNFLDFVRRENLTDLVFVLGGAQWEHFLERLESELGTLEGTEDLILRVGYVDDEDLPVLYSGAFCFVYASLYEGFGLPPLEAMACGCPVIVSNNSSLPEVVGDAGIMVDVSRHDAVAEALKTLYHNPDLRRSLAERGHERARQFSWDRCAGTMARAFAEHPGKQLTSFPVAAPDISTETVYPVLGWRRGLVFERSRERTRVRLLDRITLAETIRRHGTTTWRWGGMVLFRITRMPVRIAFELFGVLPLLIIRCGDDVRRNSLSLSLQRWFLEHAPRHVNPSLARFAQVIGNNEYVPTLPLVYVDHRFDIRKVLTTCRAFERRKGRFVLQADAVARLNALDPTAKEARYLDFAPNTASYPVDYFSPDTSVSFDVPRFGQNRVGFCSPESWGTWTMGHSVRFKFGLRPVPCCVTICFTVNPFISDAHPRLRVDVKANGRRVAVWRFRFGRPSPKTAIQVGAGMLGSDGTVVLEFVVRNPSSPLRLGCGSDNRLLGLGFVRMDLMTQDRSLQPVAFDKPYTFDREHPEVMTDGLGGAESWGRWSVGSAAAFLFALPEHDGDIAVCFDLQPFAATEKSARRITVFANGRKCCRWLFDSGEKRFDEAVRIPARLIGKDRKVRIDIRIHNPISPQAAGLGDDDRPLGIGFLGVTIHPVT